MDSMTLPHKKRRHDGSYSSKYRSSHKDRNWNTDNYRENRHTEHDHGNARLKEDMMEIHLIGRKCTNPMIHVCEICSLPILSYGRMIPCKHVFCFSCAKKTDNNCPRCKESMQRIEQCPLGSVWLCALTASCRRTYLSQRDLQAHINHRHKPSIPPVLPQLLPPVSSLGLPITVPPPPLMQPNPGNDPYLLVQAQVPPVSNPLSAPTRVPPVSTPVPTPGLTPVSNPLPTPNRVTPISHPARAPPVSNPLSTQVESAPRPSSNLITIQIQDSSQSFPPPPPPGRPPNQPQLYPPQSQPQRYHH